MGYIENDLDNTKTSIKTARLVLGKRANNMSDQQIGDLLNMMRFISNKTIDGIVSQKQQS